MTLAVVVATEEAPVSDAVLSTSGTASSATAVPTPACELPLGDTTPLERLLGQLAEYDVHETHVITRPDLAPVLRKDGYEVVESEDLAGDLREIARLARIAREQMVVVHGDVVMHGEMLSRALLIRDPATVIVSKGAADGPVLRIVKDLVVSAGSAYQTVTDPNARFDGVLVASADGTRALARVADELTGLLPLPEVSPVRHLRHEPPEADASGALPGDVVALLLTGLVRSGVKTGIRDTGVLVCERALDSDQAASALKALDAVDEERERLSAAVKGEDGFFTTFAVSTYSRYIARWCSRRGFTPNLVTSVSMGIAVLAAVWFAAGSRLGMLLGAGLLYVAFVFDCVDGQLARYSRQFSTLGAWLDATFDRAKEYVVYAGLAIGSTAAAASSSVHSGDVWPLAVAAMILQTCRHMIDFSFGAVRQATQLPLPVLPLDAPDDSQLDPPPRRRGPQGRGLGHLAVWLSAHTEKLPAVRWAKKIVVLPIGERFALIAITAALFNARVTFMALLIWGGCAMFYTGFGRILRTMAQSKPKGAHESPGGAQ